LARGRAKGDDLGVGTTKLLMPAFGDNLPINGNDTANEWVGLDESLTAHSQTECVLHVTLIDFGKHVSDPAARIEVAQCGHQARRPV
jgi:hypothetical protein